MTKAWTTEQECRFITWLGRGVFCNPPQRRGQPIPRAETLMNYKRVLLCRADWGRMDRAAVMAHLDAEVARELVAA